MIYTYLMAGLGLKNESLIRKGARKVDPHTLQVCNESNSIPKEEFISSIL